MIPLVMQLLPEIVLVYDDDTHIPGLSSKPRRVDGNDEPKWCWLVSCGAFFLMDVERKMLLSHQRLSQLVAYYLRTSGRSIAALEADDALDGGGTQPMRGLGLCTPSAHVQLIEI